MSGGLNCSEGWSKVFPKEVKVEGESVSLWFGGRNFTLGLPLQAVLRAGIMPSKGHVNLALPS